MSVRPPRPILRLSTLDNACWQCRQHLAATSSPFRAHPTRTFAQSFAPRNAVPIGQRHFGAEYFLSNVFLSKIRDAGTPRRSSTAAVGDEAQSQTSRSASIPYTGQELPPHRRRQAARRAAAAAAASSMTASADSTSSKSDSALPAEDASSALTTSAAKLAANSFRRQVSLYLSLSKPRLSVLVVLTAMSSYALYPVPAFLSPAIGLDTPSLSPLTLTFLSTGIALCSSSANTLNMMYEPDTDAKMSRTRNRPLVRGLVSQRKALIFAIVTAVTGVGALYFGVNPSVAALGAANIVIYAGMYTPMKRLHWLNTWLGAIVGGIPPLMGWAAAAGESATGTGSFRELLLTKDALGGWLLAALLFAWQFPHFMSLSWTIREEYRRAGHQMLAWINPARNARVALRYSLIFFPICFGLCAAGITEWSYAVTSTPVNAWLTREAYRFWKQEGMHGSARGLFWASVWHLPLVMVLALCQKKGMWERVWRALFGEGDEEDDYWEDDDEA